MFGAGIPEWERKTLEGAATGLRAGAEPLAKVYRELLSSGRTAEAKRLAATLFMAYAEAIGLAGFELHFTDGTCLAVDSVTGGAG